MHVKGHTCVYMCNILYPITLSKNLYFHKVIGEMHCFASKSCRNVSFSPSDPIHYAPSLCTPSMHIAPPSAASLCTSSPLLHHLYAPPLMHHLYAPPLMHHLYAPPLMHHLYAPPPPNAPSLCTPPPNAPSLCTPPPNAPSLCTPPPNAPSLCTPPPNAPSLCTPP